MVLLHELQLPQAGVNLYRVAKAIAEPALVQCYQGIVRQPGVAITRPCSRDAGRGEENLADAAGAKFLQLAKMGTEFLVSFRVVLSCTCR